MRILLVDDHELLSQALAFTLRRAGLDVVAVAPTSPQAVLDGARAATPELVLLDLHLGAGVGDSLPLIAPLGSLGCDVVMLTGETDRLRLAECIEQGAAGVVDKTVSFERLVADVQYLADGGRLLPLPRREALLTELRSARRATAERAAPFDRLTVRESEVLQHLVDGRSVEAIAVSSYVSIATVRSHVRSILAKLEVGSQLAAVAMAHRIRWTFRPESSSADHQS